MSNSDDHDWPSRLRPLVLGTEPLDGQLCRRLGIALVAVGLLLGMAVFVLTVFSGFGHWRIGLALAGLIALVATQIGLGYLRLRWVVAAYQAAQSATFERPTGQPSLG